MDFRHKTSPINKKRMAERNKRILYLWYKVGLTGPEISRREGITRTRIHQIIKESKPQK